MRASLWVVLILIQLLVGMRAYPATNDSHPLLTTTRLAHLYDYRREATGWVGTLHKLDQALIEILGASNGELLMQNNSNSRVIRGLQSVGTASDQMPVPAAFENVNTFVGTGVDQGANVGIHTVHMVVDSPCIPIYGGKNI